VTTLIALALRAFAKARFRLLGLATIRDIPTERFNRIAEQLVSAGWRKTHEYAGIDAWIDYGEITLRKNKVRLRLEWDNWTEGSIEGPADVVEEIGHEIGFPVARNWRWAEHD
jgi:hypothetical protein